ncbi:MAG: threonine synthase [Pirellula sp.]|nr:threonine synthase [Pirellula sp.]
MKHYLGTKTGRRYPIESMAWHGDGGELLDLEPFSVAFPLDKIRARPGTLWRYQEALPFDASDDSWKSITMGEGFTPLVQLDPEQPHLFAKVDYMMPTLSFKDRGAAVLVAKAKSLGAKHLVQDSSGNAGTSIAAYAARAGLRCTIFVPEATSPKKLKQISLFGAELRIIAGSREATASAAKEFAKQDDVFYASHVYNPFFYQGTKTYAFELWEQLGKAPDTLILPVGNGTLVLGCFYGFSELLAAKMIDRLPRIVAVQSGQCDPLTRAFANDNPVVEPVVNQGTAAEGIAIAAPARGTQIVHAIRASRGTIVSIAEDLIEPARRYLASRGYDVEPTSAVNIAAFTAYPKWFPPNETVVLPLCGAGIKSL